MGAYPYFTNGRGQNMTILAVFRSRSETLAFTAALRNLGAPVQAVNTPKEAGVGCGISARFEDGFLPRARRALQAGRYASFAGFMRRTGRSFEYL